MRQGYLTAKYVFEHVKPGSINFVLIGLTPYSLRYDNLKSFAVCPRNLQYVWTLKNSQDNSPHGQLLQLLVSEKLKKYFLSTTAEQADLNFDGLKNSVNREFPVNALVTWEDELKNLTKKFFPETVKQNLQILEEYIKLCLKNGAKPVGVMFPFAPMMHDNYNKELLTTFRLAMAQLEKIYDFKFVDLFDLNLDYSHFYNMAHLNWKGSIAASSILSVLLHAKEILPFENLCRMNYSFFNILSRIASKESYNELMSRVFKISAEKIRRKNKVKIGFVLYDSSMWCGDGIYNFFAKNKRCEVTIFLCLRRDKLTDETVIKDFEHGVEQFRAKGLNVVTVKNPNENISPQDVIIFLTPYFAVLPQAFQLDNLTAETLMTYIPYGFSTAEYNTFNFSLINCIWKIFLETKVNVGFYLQNSILSENRICYSGYPKMDFFLEDKSKFNYEWKMATPDAKKIIWAPHWSINGGVMYSTFQWNYEFMYEYAKAHPEISWVVKPHPNLLFSAVENKIFSSAEEFQNYLQKWNDLPNAKVETGAYYQNIFATSDGMIQDSGSFIGEYQYTHKPMIYLTRDTQKFNELGEELMKVLYRVDGKDLNGIAALMQKVFIEGKDEMYNARLNFFDKYCNYQKANGMSASEFIFRQISKELE